MGTYIFFLTPSFPTIGLDQLKYCFGLVVIGLDGLNKKVLVNIGKDQLIFVKMLVGAYR